MEKNHHCKITIQITSYWYVYGMRQLFLRNVCFFPSPFKWLCDGLHIPHLPWSLFAPTNFTFMNSLCEQTMFSNCNCTPIPSLQTSSKAFLTNKSQSSLASVNVTYCRHGILKYVVKIQVLCGTLRYLSESTNCTVQAQMFINQPCIMSSLFFIVLFQKHISRLVQSSPRQTKSSVVSSVCEYTQILTFWRSYFVWAVPCVLKHIHLASLKETQYDKYYYKLA